MTSPLPVESDDIRERLWGAIADVRDASPRLANDADTWDIVDAVLAIVKPTTEPIWGITYCGDDQVDEWWEQRSDAEDYITFIRDHIAAGKWKASNYEPIRLMQSMRTEFRAIEGKWTPVDVSTPPVKTIGGSS